MSNAFNSFLGSMLDGGPELKDYQHADRLYVRETYARAPKFGFLYFVKFNINPDAIASNGRWRNGLYRNVGILVKRADLPKFSIETEVVNQYNRKTVVQKAIRYNPITLDLHDDNSDITRDLWKHYFEYYFADSTGNKIFMDGVPDGFGDTKYSQSMFPYGLNNGQQKPFFESIDIYVLHQQNYDKYTIVNPIITDWSHDTVDQSDATKILANKLTLAYETTSYSQGSINMLDNDFKAFYDNDPSPLGISGKGSTTLLGPGGLIAGAASIFGSDGSFARAKSPLDYLGVALQVRNLAKNAQQTTKAGIKTEFTGVISNALSGIAATGNKNSITIAGAANLGLQSAATVASGLKLITK